MTWRITTNQRVIIRAGQRDHVLWSVACQKLEGERILKVEEA